VYWRDLSFRRRLQRYPRYAAALVWSRWAARNEAAARAVLAADVLCSLAEAVTRPDKRSVEEVANDFREFVKQRRAYEALCKLGLADEARLNLTEAENHRKIAENLIRGWKPDRSFLLHATCHKLVRLFGFGGQEIAAGLVAAALNRRTRRWHTRHVVKKIKR
jgi:hypothetical protein